MYHVESLLQLAYDAMTALASITVVGLFLELELDLP